MRLFHFRQLIFSHCTFLLMMNLGATLSSVISGHIPFTSNLPASLTEREDQLAIL